MDYTLEMNMNTSIKAGNERSEGSRSGVNKFLVFVHWQSCDNPLKWQRNTLLYPNDDICNTKRIDKIWKNINEKNTHENDWCIR